MGLILSCEACEDPKPVSAQAAASTPRDLLLQKLFSIVDQNKSGTLDVGELSQVMDNAEEFVRVCDTDNDTQITQKEFLDWSSTHIVRHLTGACGYCFGICRSGLSQIPFSLLTNARFRR